MYLLSTILILQFVFVSAVLDDERCNGSVLLNWNTSQVQVTQGKAIASIPPGLEWAFTRCSAIPIVESFIDDSNDGKGTHYQYSTSDIAEFVDSWKRQLKFGKFRGNVEYIVSALLSLGDNSENMHYSETLRGKRIVVFGSMTPWVESLCLALGAHSILTVEYNQLTYELDSIETITVSKSKELATRDSLPLPREHMNAFDLALSISSFDHSGLTRYGDPLDPDGDILAMNVVSEYLKPGGALVLSVPVGPDLLVWNSHRQYGSLRLPLLFGGWDVRDAVGTPDFGALLELLSTPAHLTEFEILIGRPADSLVHHPFEPVFILQQRKCSASLA